jgi:hypothetical protein
MGLGDLLDEAQGTPGAGAAPYKPHPLAIFNGANKVEVLCRKVSWVRRSGNQGCIGSIFWVRSNAWIWDLWSMLNTIAFSGGAR